MSRGYRDGGGSDAAVAVTSDAIHVLRRWAESGPIEGYRGWLRADAGPRDPGTPS